MKGQVGGSMKTRFNPVKLLWLFMYQGSLKGFQGILVSAAQKCTKSEIIINMLFCQNVFLEHFIPTAKLNDYLINMHISSLRFITY